MRIIRGDLLDVKTGFIVQQCNCVTVKSHGLSAAIERRFPYCNVYKSRPRVGARNCAVKPDEPGTYKLFSCPDDDDHPVIVCLLAQWAPGKPGHYAKSYPPPKDDLKDTSEQRLVWFVEALSDFLNDCCRNKVDFKIEPVCIPYEVSERPGPYNIGCGLAGGDWGLYQKALEKLEDEFDLEFQVYKLE